MIVGVGMDLVEIARVRRLLSKGERAVRRLFTTGEASYALARPDPALHFAARVAAKEAAFKALAGSARARAIGWRELEVVNDWDGRPTVELHGLAADRAAELGVSRLWLTLSHSGGMAAAVVVLERSADASPPP